MDEPNETISAGLKEAIKQANLPEFPDLSEIQAELSKKAQANSQHTPRQRGPYLICVSCEYDHTLAYVGPFKKLVGFNEQGEPIYKDLEM